MGADRPQQPEAVEERHRHAGEHQIRGIVANRGQRGITIADDLDVATSMKEALELITHVGTIDGREDSRPGPRILNVSVPRGSPAGKVLTLAWGPIVWPHGSMLRRPTAGLLRMISLPFRNG